MIESNIKSISVRRITILGEGELKTRGGEDLDLGDERVLVERPSNLETKISSSNTYPILKKALEL